MSSVNKKKSSGLRILWIPGRKGPKRKGHYGITNKNIIHSRQQEKNQVWSLGGNKVQEAMLKTDESSNGIINPISAIPAVSLAGSCLNNTESIEREDVKLQDDSITPDYGVCELQSDQYLKGENPQIKQDKNKNKSDREIGETDEALVKCLHYTMLCCECTIS